MVLDVGEVEVVYQETAEIPIAEAPIENVRGGSIDLSAHGATEWVTRIFVERKESSIGYSVMPKADSKMSPVGALRNWAMARMSSGGRVDSDIVVMIEKRWRRDRDEDRDEER